MKKYNLVIDCSFKLSDNDGVGRYIKFLLGALQTNGVLFKAVFTGNNRLISYLTQTRFRWLRKIIHFSFINLYVPSLFLSKDKFIYHSLNMVSPFYVPANVNLISTVHDVIYKVFPQTQKKSWRIFYDIQYKLTLKNSKLLIVNSNTTKNDLVKYFNYDSSKIKTVYLGTDHLIKINSRILANFPESSKKNILFVGTIEPRKNIFTLIKAYKLLSNELQEKYELIIIGKFGWEDRTLYETLKNTSGVKWYDSIKDEDLAMFYENSSLFVYPSFYEGYGFPVFEALSYNCPVLVSDIAVFKELFNGYVSYFSVLSPNSEFLLAEKITDLLNLNMFQFEKEIKNFLTNLSWQNCALKTNQIYQEL